MILQTLLISAKDPGLTKIEISFELKTNGKKGNRIKADIV
jgi:hypothetical protein